MQFDESHLVSLARSGDLDAFGQLYRRHAPGVYNLVLRILGNPDDAEDVKQEVFLRAHRSLDSFRGNARFSTWIYRIATNLSLDELRKRKPVVSVDQLSSDSSWEPVSKNTEADPERLLQRKAARDAVQAALMAMPPHYRILIVLRHIEDLSYEEIAEVVGCSVNALNVRLHRAREAFRRALAPYMSVEELRSELPSGSKKNITVS